MLGQVVTAVLASAASLAIYRLFLSPLARARIPGPWLPALTSVCEMYYDLRLGGQFPWKLKQWHRQYGPIVRIGPDQVHIHDPKFVTQFFASTALRERYPQHQRQLGVDMATIGTLEYSMHRHRRAGLAPSLSSKSINGPVVSRLIRIKEELVADHLTRAQETGSIVDVRTLFWAFATDVVSDLTFGEGEGHRLLDDEELDPSVKGFQEDGQRKFHWFKWFPFLWKVLKSIPPERMINMNPSMKRLIEWEERKKEQLHAAIELHDRGEATHINDMAPERRCIFEHLLASTALIDEEKRFERVWEESASLLGAGVATVTSVLCILLFHLLDRPETWRRLSDELHVAMPDPSVIPPTSELLRLPYLNAVLTEGLRMGFGLTQRIARVAPHDTVVYGRYSIPAGTAIGMSSVLTHTDPEVFPEPERFWPERWLPETNDAATIKTDRELILTFGKGARQCLGINLAQAEILCTLAMVARRYTIQLYETTRRDVDVAHDSLLPMCAEGSKGVRIRVL